MSEVFQSSLKTRRLPHPNWFRTGVWLWLGVVIATSFAADVPVLRESQVKAVYLFNFANFITWPASAFESSTAPFRICVLGEDPFKDKLDLAVENEQVNGRSVEVLRLTELEQTANCQILFVSQSEQRFKAHIFAYTKQRPMLTVSDIPNFVQTAGGGVGNSGTIEFFTQGNKVRFRVDLPTLKGLGLKANSRLLKVAEVVGE